MSFSWLIYMILLSIRLKFPVAIIQLTEGNRCRVENMKVGNKLVVGKFIAWLMRLDTFIVLKKRFGLTKVRIRKLFWTYIDWSVVGNWNRFCCRYKSEIHDDELSHTFTYCASVVADDFELQSWEPDMFSSSLGGEPRINLMHQST